MKTIDDYIQQVKELVEQQHGDVTVVEEYYSHLLAEFEDYRLTVLQEFPDELVEAQFVAKLEGPEKMVSTLLIGRALNQITEDEKFKSFLFDQQIIQRIIKGYIYSTSLFLTIFLIFLMLGISFPISLINEQIVSPLYILVWPVYLITSMIYGLTQETLSAIGSFMFFIIYTYFRIYPDLSADVPSNHQPHRKKWAKLGKIGVFYILAGGSVSLTTFLIFFLRNIQSSQASAFILYVGIIWPLLPLIFDIDALIAGLTGYIVFASLVYYFMYEPKPDGMGQSKDITSKVRLVPTPDSLSFQRQKIYRIIVFRWVGAYTITALTHFFLIYFLYYFNGNILFDLGNVARISVLWPFRILAGSYPLIISLNNYSDSLLLAIAIFITFLLLVQLQWEKIFPAFNRKLQVQSWDQYYSYILRLAGAYIFAGLSSVLMYTGYFSRVHNEHLGFIDSFELHSYFVNWIGLLLSFDYPLFYLELPVLLLFLYLLSIKWEQKLPYLAFIGLKPVDLDLNNY